MKSKRLLSLDVMRGITIAGMILVNNAGNYQYTFQSLKHASWNGLHLADLVFPFFVFMMGISLAFSIKRSQSSITIDFVKKAFKRSVYLFVIGLALNWIGDLFYRFPHMNSTNILDHFNASIENIRILGVFQRLALSYLFATIALYMFKGKYIIQTTLSLLVIYSTILLLGNGTQQSHDNILAVIDSTLLPDAHILKTYSPEGYIPLDPEGFLATLSSIAQVLLGYLLGVMIISTQDNKQKILKFTYFATTMLFSGYLFSFIIPINKTIWSPSFTLVTSGYATLFFILLYWIIDMKSKIRWTHFFTIFGVNPLFLYITAALLAYLFNAIPIIDGNSIHSLIYNNLAKAIPNFYIASLGYSILFVVINWSFGYILHKYKLIIKL